MQNNKIADTGEVVIIINSIKPYLYEINNILFVPEGFAYRVRFRKKWIKDDTTKFPNRNGLIILRDFETAKFYPIRRIMVTEILTIGDVTYIDYRLAGMVEFDSDKSIRDNQVLNFNTQISATMKIDSFNNEPNQNLEKLVFLHPDLAYNITDNSYVGSKENKHFNTWGNLVELLGELPCYNDFDFLKLLYIKDVNQNKADILVDKKNGNSSYKIIGNQIYEAFICQRAFTEKQGDSSVETSRYIEISNISDNVDLIQAKSNIAGKYDLYRFSFKATAKIRRQSAHLYLDVKRSNPIDDDNVAEKLVLPSINIPITISASRSQIFIWIFSVLVFSAGFLMVMLADYLHKNSPVFSVFEPNVIQSFGVLSMVLGSSNVGNLTRYITERYSVEVNSKG